MCGLPQSVVSLVSLSRTTTTTTTTSAAAAAAPWTFRGHDVYTETAVPDSLTNKKQPAISVVLVHGFGCSSTYWRETKTALLQSGCVCQVHVLDLLGQGKSAKPGRADGIEYSIHLWAELIDAYIQEKIPSGEIILCGNSLGSLVALSAVTGDFTSTTAVDVETTSTWSDRCKGICMFNAGVGLNARGIANELQWTAFQKFLINALYNVLDALIFRNTALLTYVLSEVVTQDLLRDALSSLYKCQPDRVDDELVDSFYLPAQDKGSVEALSQIYTNEPGATPMDLHRNYADLLAKIPIHLIWGDDDAVTPILGGVGKFYTNMAKEQDNVSFQTVSSGHIPFDDNPVDSHNSMLQWINKL
jgi:pimeloyl-ACP methyl ester carboxylesterase